MTPLTYNGITYRSRLALCKALNIDNWTLKTRLNRGWSLKDAIETPIKPRPKQVKLNGKVYNSITEAAKAFGLTRTAVATRLSKGWSLEQAFQLKPRLKKRSETCNGRVYIIRNTNNNKVYIGITTKGTKQRFKEHKLKCHYKNSKLYLAMRLLGIENFYCRVLDRTTSLSKLAALESYYIKKYNSIETGYNSVSGGNIGGWAGKSLVYKHKIFRTIGEAALYAGVSRDVFTNSIARGEIKVIWLT